MTKKQKAKLGLILLPTGSLLSLLMLWVVLVWPIYKTFQSRNWPQVECIIDTYQVREAGLFQGRYGNTVQYKVDFQYSYLFNGKQYVSTRTSFNDGLLYGTKPPSKISKIRTCYVNPNNPSEAIFVRQYNFFFLLLSAFPALALAMCIYGFFRCKKILQKKPPKMSQIIR